MRSNILVLFLITCLRVSLSAQVYSEADKAALIALDLTCDASNTLNWNTEADPSAWNGVDWNMDNPRRVSHLWLAGKSLTGNFDASALSGLIEIYCIDNQLTGLNFNNLTNLTAISCWSNELTTLGVSGLTNLTSLQFDQNHISSLETSDLTALITLSCSDNDISELNVSGLTDLTYLNCSQNQLTQLDITNLDDLQQLLCFDNQISSLDIDDKVNLTRLTCSNNQLTTLNVTALSDLTTLECNGNQLTNLEVDNLSNLTILSCASNFLTELNVGNLINLTSLVCSNNQLAILNAASLTNLHTLICFDNLITTLAVDNLINLTRLSCSSNQLNSLNVANLTNLSWLDCSQNHIPTLDIENLTKLNVLYCESNELSELNVNNCTLLTTLGCGSNQLDNLELSNIASLEYLYCSNNNLTELNTGNLLNLNGIYCEHNHLPFSSLINGVHSGVFNYDPQDTLYEAQTLTGDRLIDYSMEAMIEGISSEFVFYKDGVESESNSTGLYNTLGEGEYYCKMTNDHFPALTLYTSPITILNEPIFNAGDKAALLAIDTACDAQNSLNWNTETDPQKWEGVTWNTSDTARVIGLHLSGKPLTGHLDATPLSELTIFYYKLTQISSLDFSNLIHLTTIGCKISNLTSINLTNLPELTTLNCNINQLEELDLNDLTNLTYLNCDTNQLTNLDLTGLTKIKYVSCFMNQITNLDLSNLPDLISITCYRNKIPFSSLATGLYITNFNYNPQDTLYEEETIVGNTTLDYSTESIINGIPTQFVFYKNNSEIETNTTGMLTTTGNGEYYCNMTNSLFPELTLTTSVITIMGATGFIDAEDTFTEIYPNPVSNYIYFTHPEGIEMVVLYSLTGNEIFRKRDISNGLSLSNIPHGTYLLEIIQNGQLKIRKIQKE